MLKLDTRLTTCGLTLPHGKNLDNHHRIRNGADDVHKIVVPMHVATVINRWTVSTINACDFHMFHASNPCLHFRGCTERYWPHMTTFLSKLPFALSKWISKNFWGSLPRGVWEILIAEVVDFGNDLPEKLGCPTQLSLEKRSWNASFYNVWMTSDYLVGSSW